MPLFLSDDEFRLIAGDSSAVAERADAFIRDLRRQLDTVRAEADAASIAAEQTCSLLEQKYSTLYSDFSRLQSDNAQLSTSVELRLSEIANAQAEKHQLHLKAIGKDGEIERMSLELAELQKARRQLLELLEQKDAEIQERNATIQCYLDKIVKLTESNTSKEARVHEAETELGRCRAAYSRVSQEKELLEKHNSWLNDELTAKVNSLVELRRTHMHAEAELSSKVVDLEREHTEALNSLNWNKERVHELELRVNSLEEELRTSKEAAAANEEHFAAELATVTKLVELYKASSEEWSKKAGELEGVIKALETHLSQSQNDYKEKLEKEVAVRKDLEKEAAALKEKIEKSETELENMRKTNELSFLPQSSFHSDFNSERLLITEAVGSVTNEISDVIVPRVPIGISGTALAASLLRDGWSLAKMYEKYQEANDAFLHERLERRKAEMTLKQVFHEIEEKVEMILDERAEHDRMVEAYTLMDQKLREALSEHDNLESTVRQLKAELKMSQRHYTVAQTEINDLQKQVTLLLKECQDVQLRCGGVDQVAAVNSLTESAADLSNATDAERIISDHLLTFNDINGLVEQNVHLRRLVHSFSLQEEKRDAEIREDFQIKLQKVTEEAAAKVETVLKRSQEQSTMIESLHSSVAMYKRLYEEERKIRVSGDTSAVATSDDGKRDDVILFERSQEVSNKSHEQLAEHARNLEEELASLRKELFSMRSECDKMSLEVNFAKERLGSSIKECDHQRQEANAVSARNLELTHLIVDYQRRLRECSDSLQASEENSRKLSMEVSFLKHEKDILMNSEKRASDEARSWSERAHRLQSSLDTIQSAADVRENARASEMKKHEEYVKQVEMEWAEAKKELQEERDRVRSLTLDKEKTLENSLRQVEEMRKELSEAWRAVASAESRAAVAETRYSDLETKVNRTEKQKITKKNSGGEHSTLSTDEVHGELWKTEEELNRLKDEAQANKEYMLQYKEIAQTNENALKQIESAHEEYKLQAEKLKKALEDEVQTLRNKVQELESDFRVKSEQSALVIESKEHALSDAMAENLRLREEIAEKISQIELLKTQVSSLTDDVDKEHKRWRTAQDNYERQIVLQSETIQELTNTSKELSVLQSEITKLRELSDAQKTENDLLVKSWEYEKVELQKLKSEAEMKYNELNEQNKVLHNRLEAMHIKLADKEHSSSRGSLQSTDSQADNDFQNVVSYLRRSKEIAETEISLLKQEKLRLQSQLEVALKASENAQALLRSQGESSRAQLFKDEDFKALQFQVREINLLRESNVQLRAENKHNFEEAQKFREEAKKAKIEAENLGSQLRAKEIELDACQKEVEKSQLEIGHLNSRITELYESTKNVDIGEYERMKDELQHIKVLLRESELSVELTRKLLSEKEDHVVSLEQILSKCQSDLAEQEKKLKDVVQVEVSIRLENEKQKKYISVLKKKNEALTREKEEFQHKNHALLKQIEDYKSSRKNIIESSSEQAKKDQERDTRIQTLERTVERQKEELKKEKDKDTSKTKLSQSTRNIFMDSLQKVKEAKTKVEEELAKHKHAIGIILEHSGITAAQLPLSSNLDEQTLAYFQCVSNIVEFADSTLSESDGQTPLPTEPPTVDAASASLPTGRQVGSHLVRLSTPQAKATEEREKGSTVAKPIGEARKPSSVRRIIRPRLEKPAEPMVDSEIPGNEPSSVTEEGKSVAPHEPEPPIDTSSQVPSIRKRPAPSSLLETRKESGAQEEAGTEIVPSLKKSKHAEALEGSSDVVSAQPSMDTYAMVHVSQVSSVTLESQPVPAEDMDTDRALTLSSDDITDNTKAEEGTADIKEEAKEEIEELKEAFGAINQDDEAPCEGAMTDGVSDKPDMELNDEPKKNEDVRDLFQPAVESEDEREEGELMPDDLGQQEDEVSGDMPNDSITGEEGDIGDEVVDTTEAASPEIPAERSEEVNVIEEIAEASNKHSGDDHDQGAPDASQSPQRSTPYNINDQSAPDSSSHSPQKAAATQEGSPAPLSQTSVSGRRSPSPSTVTADTEEPPATRGGRTINLARPRESRLRQQPQGRSAALSSSRGGRGRTLGGARRENTRGSRGRGRGQAFGDRE